jgi:hypothetical protein
MPFNPALGGSSFVTAWRPAAPPRSLPPRDNPHLLWRRRRFRGGGRCMAASRCGGACLGRATTFAEEVSARGVRGARQAGRWWSAVRDGRAPCGRWRYRPRSVTNVPTLAPGARPPVGIRSPRRPAASPAAPRPSIITAKPRAGRALACRVGTETAPSHAGRGIPLAAELGPAVRGQSRLAIHREDAHRRERQAEPSVAGRRGGSRCPKDVGEQG